MEPHILVARIDSGRIIFSGIIHETICIPVDLAASGVFDHTNMVDKESYGEPMTRWARFLHTLGMHRWVGHYNPPANRVRGGWVRKYVCQDCGAEEIVNTWLE